MNGKTIKYRKYKGQGSGTLNIPISIADALNWKDHDKISLVIEVIDGQKGIFLFKKEK